MPEPRACSPGRNPAPRLVDGTGVELVRPIGKRGPPRVAMFDFDGTLSLIREGWMDIMVPMMVDHILPLARPGETRESIERLALAHVTELTGRQTVYQMIRLACEVEHRGGTPRDPLDYKKEFLDLLAGRIDARRKGLADCSLSPADMLVPGSLDLLGGLRDLGVSMYIASGTDEPYVREEARLLGLDTFGFAGIHGARDDYENHSKASILDRILAENRADGRDLVVFGDGFVEISVCRDAGGTAVGVASDEAGRSGTVDPWKRERLLDAGADIVVPDFSDASTIVGLLWPERGARKR